MHFEVAMWDIICVCAIITALSNVSATPTGRLLGPELDCRSESSKTLTPFEVLPGTGWDNLRNTAGTPLVKFNFSLCKTTNDGKYLVPNDVYITPKKSSKIDTYAEFYSNWQDYKSVTSKSINVNSGLKFATFGISGSFSYESEKIRSRQTSTSSATAQVQLRYKLYSVRLQPKAPLHENFRSNLHQIAYNIHLNKEDMARYVSQLLVRDFGTHVLTRVDAGATLVQTDTVKTDFVKLYNSDKNNVLAAISARYQGSFSFNLKSSVGVKNLKTITNQYVNSVQYSEVETFGGPLFKKLNFSINDWIVGIKQNLVAIDRAGDPIYYLITKEALPELPSYTVYLLRRYVKEAVETYYKFNTYFGCTKADSPNFSFEANLDDGSCESPTNNFTFGGLYQTCQRFGDLGSVNHCDKLQQKNPMTGQFSCSSEYHPVLLDSDAIRYATTRRRCKRCYLLARCCKDVVITGLVKFSSYWCAAKGTIPSSSGFLFGGIYTTLIKNPLTDSFSCPAYFFPLQMGKNIRVCVSSDYELGYRYSVPFAGFFSCKAGNPLNSLSKTSSGRKRNSLRSYAVRSSNMNHTRGCPRGYSEHLATISNGCEINYCIEAHAFSNRNIPAIKRPPFVEIPSSGFAENESISISENGHKWLDMKETISNKRGKADNHEESALSTGGIVAIAVTITVSCVTIVTVIYLSRKRLKKATCQRQESASLLPNKHVSYGSEETEMDATMT